MNAKSKLDNFQTLTFIVPFKDLPKKTLQIGVYDHDLGKHDDYIGGTVFESNTRATKDDLAV